MQFTSVFASRSPDKEASNYWPRQNSVPAVLFPILGSFHGTQAVMQFTSVFASRSPDEEASMCDVKKGDEIRRDFPSLRCIAGIYLLAKRSRFGHSWSSSLP